MKTTKTATTTKAIIGLDGLSAFDVLDFDFPGTYHEMPIETVAHTCPSWNAIFSGDERYGVYDFWKVPDDYPDGATLAEVSDEKWSYDELSGNYLWDVADGVSVVSAPVVLPTHSTIDAPPDLADGWPTTRDEVESSIFGLASRTLHERDRSGKVVCVFPVPDKPNHLQDNPDVDYDTADHRDHLALMADTAHTIADAFDEWVFISDHGRPAAPKETVDLPGGRLKVATHEPVGLVASNAIDFGGKTGLTNITVCDHLRRFMNE